MSRVLRHLEQRRWLDHGTKVLFVELTVFNANVNLLCAVTLILESNSVGTGPPLLALQAGYLRTGPPLLTIYHSFK